MTSLPESLLLHVGKDAMVGASDVLTNNTKITSTCQPVQICLSCPQHLAQAFYRWIAFIWRVIWHGQPSAFDMSDRYQYSQHVGIHYIFSSQRYVPPMHILVLRLSRGVRVRFVMFGKFSSLLENLRKSANNHEWGIHVYSFTRSSQPKKMLLQQFIMLLQAFAKLSLSIHPLRQVTVLAGKICEFLKVSNHS